MTSALVLLMALPRAGAQEPGQSAVDAGANESAPLRPAPARAVQVPPAGSAVPVPTPDVYGDTDPDALTYFRPTLDPYGTWIEHPVYGVVWVPDPRYAGADFAPYLTAGHWALTTNGDWVWVSDFPWGWVVFHYGRWVWISRTGWAWVPGRRYASAWVVWRLPEPGYEYVGWAPMPPGFVWFGGVAFVLHYRVGVPFVFCHSRYVFARSLRRHLVPPSRLRFVAAHTRRYHRPARSPRMGPPVGRTHVPASAVPRARIRPNASAVLAARRSTSGRVVQRRAPGRAMPARPGRAVPRGTRAAPRSAPRTVPRGTRAAPRSAPRAAPRPRNAPQRSAPPRARPRPAPRAAPRAPPRTPPKSRSGGRAAPKGKPAPKTRSQPHRRR